MHSRLLEREDWWNLMYLSLQTLIGPSLDTNDAKFAMNLQYIVVVIALQESAIGALNETVKPFVRIAS